MDEAAPAGIVISGLVFWSLIILVPVFFLVLFMLPEDAYGEDDVKVASKTKIPSRSRTQVLVLGDIGRSPRMQYHALSIAKHGVAVDLIGYTESKVHPDVEANKYITIHPIDKTPSFLQTSNRTLFVLFGPLKVIYQFLSLWQILGHRTRPAKWLLVQNPPSIPVLLLASWMSWLRKTRLVIDWHNFGYTILALKLGKRHAMVRASRVYERYYAGSAVANLVVSDAMKRQLAREFRVKARTITMHDRPVSDFRPLDGAERKAFLSKLDATRDHAADLANGKARLLVSSTSWTADEDFSILLDALVGYSALTSSATPQKLPSLLVVITGKGPQKEMYLERISALTAAGKLSRVAIRTAWLSTADYAALLGAADLGVSLHTSSSGVDLPMKVVDMFGAGLPVLGWSAFEAWPELVKEGVNGRGFQSADELLALLSQLFAEADGKRLATIKKGAMLERDRGWDVEWNEKVAPVFGLTDENLVDTQ